MRVVLDTNTMISALLWDGLPWEVYRAAGEEKYTLLTSDALFAEFSGVLHRPKFAPMLAAQSKIADSLLVECRELAEFVTPAEVPLDVVRDPKDRVVLACALGGNADWIVSGDKDLLVLGHYAGIPIVGTARFLEVLIHD